MQRDMVITFVKHINLPFNPLKNEPIFTKPPFYMVNEKSIQVDQFALCEQPQMGEGELHQLPHSNMVGSSFQSNLCFHHQCFYTLLLSLFLLLFSPIHN